MPKRSRDICASNRKEAYEWITQSATNEQLRTLLLKDNLSKVVRRDHILDALPLTVFLRDDLVELANRWCKENGTKRSKLAVERYAKSRALFEKQKQTRNDWLMIQRTLTQGMIVYVCLQPVVFYEWRSFRSGPGAYIVRHYEKQKTKYVKAVVLNSLPSFSKKMTGDDWDHMSVSVKLLQSAELESLGSPEPELDTSNIWQTWTIAKDTVLNMRCSRNNRGFRDKSCGWNDPHYRFFSYVNQERAKASWDINVWVLADLLSTYIHSNDISYLITSYLDFDES